MNREVISRVISPLITCLMNTWSKINSAVYSNLMSHTLGHARMVGTKEGGCEKHKSVQDDTKGKQKSGG